MCSLILQIIIVYIISAVIHEVAHSDVACYLGDNTARKQGRSSLNPFRHLSLSGFKKLPHKLTSRRDLIIMNSAGIVVNLVIALYALWLWHIQNFTIFKIIFWVNVFIVVINLIPIRPTDGYKLWQHIKH